MIDRANINVANAALNGFAIKENLFFIYENLFSFSRLLHRVDPELNGKVLPSRNAAAREQTKLESTYHADFPPPYPYEMKTVAHSEFSDKVNE